MDYIVPISEARGKLPELIKKIASAGAYSIILIVAHRKDVYNK